MNQAKTCTKCGETKSLDAYYRHKSSKDGRSSQCADCLRPYYRERRRARVREDPEREHARTREATRRSRDRRGNDREAARALANGRAASWVREHHPEVWEAILEQCEREKGVSRDLWEHTT